ncbi:hypothetical protein niasHT_020190 [Heterodera trifolii]|uniref:Serpin domain-containing protein n=1 Tax=Heterodera trifolii TaxID=157864 RepID=A0ABD2K4A1_9BILA
MISPPSPNALLILEAQADFALKLLREVSTDDRSCIVSPFSVAVTLSMVYAGAKENTAEEMGELLGNGAPESEVHQYFGTLLNSLTSGQNSSNTLETGNKVYVNKGFRVKSAFKEKIEGNYGGQMETVDFKDSEGTAEIINNFVEEATHQKIRDLITPDALDKETRLVLINALYFKGTWAAKFYSKSTKKATFHMDANNKKQLEMMHLTAASFIYFEDPELQLLGMPYKGEKEFMFVLLPKKRFGLTKLLAQLDGKKLVELIKKRRKSTVMVQLPKFTLEATHELNKPLTNMGMATAFTDSANFEGISSKKPLLISKMVQKAIIEVNEEGTVAAAVAGAAYEGPREERFVADHPFCAFLIRDDTVLFSAIFRN